MTPPNVRDCLISFFARLLERPRRSQVSDRWLFLFLSYRESAIEKRLLRTSAPLRNLGIFFSSVNNWYFSEKCSVCPTCSTGSIGLVFWKGPRINYIHHFLGRAPKTSMVVWFSRRRASLNTSRPPCTWLGFVQPSFPTLKALIQITNLAWSAKKVSQSSKIHSNNLLLASKPLKNISQ